MAFDKDNVELNKNLSKIFSLISGNEDVMRLVMDNNPDCLSESKPSVIKTKDFMYKNVYPYRYISDKKDEVKTFLNFAFVGNRLVNGSIQTNQISFFILTHYDIVRINEGSRLFTLMEAVKGLFDGNKEFKSGTWELVEISEIVGMDNYTGYQMDFTYHNVKTR